jgi:two-component system, sensor histidine kinase PdtaS
MSKDETIQHLQEQLRLRDLAIEEANHRFRNQLQIILNLLDLQAARASNPEVSESLRQCRMRVRSIAMVQEMLRPGPSAGAVYLDEYLSALAAALGDAWAGEGKGVRPIVRAARVMLVPAKAATIGLIVTELLTNAFKHAFAAGADGRIDVELSEDAGCMTLVVSDNGGGLPAGVSIKDAAAGGLRLVKALVAQLKGEVKTQCIAGTRVSIEFPAGTGVERTANTDRRNQKNSRE